MKKILATVLCIIYVIASSGATLNLHYCMGKFIGFDFAAPSTKTCSNCGMAKEQNKNCCNDKHATFRLKQEQLASTTNFVYESNIALIHKEFFFHDYLFTVTNNFLVQSVYKPPLLFSNTFIKNCVFLI